MAFQAALDMADDLGFSPKAVPSPINLVALVRQGLRVTAIDTVARRVAPEDAAFRYRLVPKATLARRKDRLSAEESERLMRVASLWRFAIEVWGSEEAARRFLFAPHMLLDDQTPMDVALGSELGAKVVEDVLGGLLHGTAV
ncbi:antitoxin Xre/MbcA/ParS toxin-binding domain-containing protein [Zavarzinia sp. CC-PAN008]|uniref:antitoxin Xre/MbcA/ParS toxin-binding domain-containing protein n=1 Tax=Zavarzinia sp. CC-PAN008 TaxID=3243332 RepID=UPI003F74356B